MTTGLIKINFSDQKYFNIYLGSDARPEDIKKDLGVFLSYVSMDELEKGNKSRLNWQYMASNFMRFLMEKYLNKNSFNCNRVCIAPEHWETDTISHIYEMTPNDKFPDFSVDVRDTIELKIIK